MAGAFMKKEADDNANAKPFILTKIGKVEILDGHSPPQWMRREKISVETEKVERKIKSEVNNEVKPKLGRDIKPVTKSKIESENKSEIKVEVKKDIERNLDGG